MYGQINKCYIRRNIKNKTHTRRNRGKSNEMVRSCQEEDQRNDDLKSACEDVEKRDEMR